jgi:NAD(P)H-dependent FMN reductase
MLVLGIVGSPRRERGLSRRVVTSVLSGAQAADAETQILYLIDEEPTGVRSQAVAEADALVVCAPVYNMQVNGLTVSTLFDKAKLVKRVNAGRMDDNYWNGALDGGRPALGIAVAGGAGGGVFAALQSIYAWLFVWGFRPLDPLPVTQYNLARVLDEAPVLGETLARRTPQPFEGVSWDKSLFYDDLPYLDFGRVDEQRWLAEQITEGLKARDGDGACVSEIERHLDRGRACAAKADRRGAAQSHIQAFKAGYFAWRGIGPG